jgi:hypothetical protein
VTKAPSWDARGIGQLPWQGVACIDVNDDASLIALGTIAPPGDPNVLLLDGTGKVLRQQRAGQRWIDQIAVPDRSQVVRALCTMPAGRSADVPELYRAEPNGIEMEKVNWRRSSYADTYFHYGQNSNHITRFLSRAGSDLVLVNGDMVTWLDGKGTDTSASYPMGETAHPVSLAAGNRGIVVVGTTTAPGESAPANLHVLMRGDTKAIWSRPAETKTEDAPRLEKGQCGMPTLPDGTRAELPQRDEKVSAPLAVAVHVEATSEPGVARWRVAAADYQGWQRWVRSSATRKDENLGTRFMPSRPDGLRFRRLPDWVALAVEALWHDGTMPCVVLAPQP